MPKKSDSFIPALASFFGTTIGVGIFALPFAYQYAFPASILLLVAIALILISLYSMYIEILLEKGVGFHQLPGIVSKIWGKKARNAVGIILLIGRTGIMFLYTVILADFGSLIIENILGVTISPTLISIVATFLTSIAIAGNVKIKSKAELLLSSAIVGIIGMISIAGILQVLSNSPDTFAEVFKHDRILLEGPLSENIKILGTIYGVTIGALSGIAAIPALKGISRNKDTLLKATRVGTALVVILYGLFALFVVTTSTHVSGDALTGLGDSWWVTLLAVGGFLSVITSYLGVGNSLFEVYHHDYELPEIPSWLLTFLPPAVLFIAGIDNFTYIAAVIGGVIGGSEGLIILASYWKLESSQNDLPLGKKIPAAITALILGIGLILAL